MPIPPYPSPPVFGAHTHMSVARESDVDLPIEPISLPGSSSSPYSVAPALASPTPPPGVVGSLELPAPGDGVRDSSVTPDAASTVDDAASSAATVRPPDRATIADLNFNASPLSGSHSFTANSFTATSTSALASDLGAGAASVLASGNEKDLRSPAKESHPLKSRNLLGQVIAPSIALFGAPACPKHSGFNDTHPASHQSSYFSSSLPSCIPRRHFGTSARALTRPTAHDVRPPVRHRSLTYNLTLKSANNASAQPSARFAIHHSLIAGPARQVHLLPSSPRVSSGSNPELVSPPLPAPILRSKRAPAGPAAQAAVPHSTSERPDVSVHPPDDFAAANGTDGS